MVLRRYSDEARDMETLGAVRRLRAAMEAMEYAFFKEGSVTWEDVTVARDEYWDVWEERRNFVLGEKHGLTKQEFDERTGASEEANLV